MQNGTRSAIAWSGNESATQRVTQLLEESGALAESRVSAICHKFASKAHKRRGVHVQSDSLTYGLDSESSPLRQIDQLIDFYKEFPLNEQGGVVLRLQVPIEVKHRKDLQLFGVEYPKHSYRPRMPMTGFLNGTEVFREIALSAPFSALPLLHPVLLEIHGGATPQKVFGENIFHNAGGSLYDYIHFDLAGNPGELDDLPYGADVIDSLGLMEKFDEFLNEKHFAWWSVIRDWMVSNFTDETVRIFNDLLGDSGLHQTINLYCPVVCMDLPMWTYDGQTFKEIDSLLTRIRVNRWPGSVRQRLVGYTTEAPLLIANQAGLPRILDESKRWFYEVEDAISRSDARVKNRWFIESAFYQMAVKKGFNDEPYPWVRSDVDILSDV